MPSEDTHVPAERLRVLAQLQDAAHDAGRLFPLSLGAESSCTIGGNLCTNAGGTQVLRYGNMRDLALGLKVVTADGEIWDGLMRRLKQTFEPLGLLNPGKVLPDFPTEIFP